MDKIHINRLVRCIELIQNQIMWKNLMTVIVYYLNHNALSIKAIIFILCDIFRTIIQFGFKFFLLEKSVKMNPHSNNKT